MGGPTPPFDPTELPCARYRRLDPRRQTPCDLTANKLIAATRLPAIAMEEAQYAVRFARSLDGHADGSSNCLAIVEDMESGSALLQLLRERTRISAIGRHPDGDEEARLARHQCRF
jgi:hypothetical protein